MLFFEGCGSDAFKTALYDMKKNALIRLWNLFRYYSLGEFLGKAHEKHILDRKRYGGVPQQSVSSRPEADSLNIQSYTKETDGEGPSVCYLVHFFYPDKTGGTERFVFNQAKAKLNTGGAARVVTLSVAPKSHYTNRTGNILWRDYVYEGVPVTEYRYVHTPCGTYYKRIEENADMEAFARMLFNRENFDVVHCAFPQPFAGMLKVCREVNLPYLITNTGFGIFCHYTTLIDRNGAFCADCEGGRRCGAICPTYGVSDPCERFRLSERMLRGASAITSPSLYVSRRVEREYPGLYVLTVPHGIDAGFTRGERVWQGKRFVFAGTFTRMKGIHLLIDAFKQMPQDAVLDLYGAGDQEYESELKKQAGDDPRIHFFGFVSPDQIVQIYRQHDVAVIPSLVPETYCFVLREALNCGCAVVASDIGAMSEVVKPGANGYLFPPGDGAALAAAMKKAAALNGIESDGCQFPNIEWESTVYENLYRRLREESLMAAPDRK